MDGDYDLIDRWSPCILVMITLCGLCMMVYCMSVDQHPYPPDHLIMNDLDYSWETHQIINISRIWSTLSGG